MMTPVVRFLAGESDRHLLLDQVESGPKPEIVRALGATYHTGTVADLGFESDVVIECTGVGQVINDVIRGVGAGGIVCLTGVGAGGSTVGPPVADVAAAAVLKNNVVVGSVNANKRHWYKAGQVLTTEWRRRNAHRREAASQPVRGSEYTALGGSGS